MLLLSVSAAKAQILLIDDSNPDAVVITATTGTATATQDIGLSDGFELLQFFTQSTGQNYNVTANAGSTLTGIGLTAPDVVTNAFGDDYTLGEGYVDLNLFNPNSNENLDFTQGNQAFTGTLVLDLHGEALPTNGSTGTVQTGFYDDGNNAGVPVTTIGTYEVVNPTVTAPEPSTWMLIGVSLLGWVIYRLRLRLVRIAGQ